PDFAVELLPVSAFAVVELLLVSVFAVDACAFVDLPVVEPFSDEVDAPLGLLPFCDGCLSCAEAASECQS
ncbi:MAG TPA: hypothetical protein V6C69_12445, partial [Trichormus sp.]